MRASAKAMSGVILMDLPTYARSLLDPARGWRAIRNRSERLEAAPDGSGFRCDWQWTSDLLAPKLFPSLGRLLMRRALAAHRIAEAAPHRRPDAHAPDVTFLIGHRGQARLPHLLATLASIAAQKSATVECIVIEQDAQSQLRERLPPWVKLVHTPPPVADMPYCRSWTFNVGAQHARSAVLVLHDNDMLVPEDYSAEILARVAQGYDVINLKRFIFYLTKSHTQQFFDGRTGLLNRAPETVVQNLEGGGSIAITSDAFARIGGLDESFVGWGGEDNEFWDRAQTLRVWPWGRLPLVHLWHPAQPGKRDPKYHTALHYSSLVQRERGERIRHLLERPRGLLAGPEGWAAQVDPRR